MQDVDEVYQELLWISDLDKRVLIAGSIAERLQTGYGVRETIRLANDIDLFLPFYAFKDDEVNPLKIKSKLGKKGYNPFVFWNELKDDYLQRVIYFETEKGIINLLSLDDLAYSNALDLELFLNSGSENYYKSFENTSRFSVGMNKTTPLWS
jgi:hypothetical protein